jgi:hypothetical protein
MGEPVFDDIDDILPPEPNGEVVHWMQARPISIGAAGISMTVLGAFALGALATVAALALIRRGRVEAFRD